MLNAFAVIILKLAQCKTNLVVAFHSDMMTEPVALFITPIHSKYVLTTKPVYFVLNKII